MKIWGQENFCKDGLEFEGWRKIVVLKLMNKNHQFIINIKNKSPVETGEVNGIVPIKPYPMKKGKLPLCCGCFSFTKVKRGLKRRCEN
jgi:hypothetical protein